MKPPTITPITTRKDSNKYRKKRKKVGKHFRQVIQAEIQERAARKERNGDKHKN